ncbi:class I SAM-dependent methyltransferase [Lentzea tibetensis]|uniref:Class I SAM-dependent methyltransferase n=1 Tax=Lentzea tibetensis TaxID=2591470 RepID=A0A563EVW5_9PSEU|nr:class I SAM-dependent methyltransferase [Lentzea tibetensis]TWP51845.1 class I SAM-dependent methyltransferase [Lentzea tibetensis]
MVNSADEHTRHLAAGASPTGWFEELYVQAAQGHAEVPWDRGSPHPLLAEWARDVDGTGRSALVVGCGLGRDSEFLAAKGFTVTAFDVSPTAVETIRRRFPDSPVDYRVADLLNPPAEWHHGFDLVVESLTVQSLPISLHAEAIAQVAGLTGDQLVVLAEARDDDSPVPDGPPWPLTPTEVEQFADGLRAERIQRIEGRWLAEFVRP